MLSAFVSGTATMSAPPTRSGGEAACDKLTCQIACDAGTDKLRYSHLCSQTARQSARLWAFELADLARGQDQLDGTVRYELGAMTCMPNAAIMSSVPTTASIAFGSVHRPLCLHAQLAMLWTMQPTRQELRGC